MQDFSDIENNIETIKEKATTNLTFRGNTSAS